MAGLTAITPASASPQVQAAAAAQVQPQDQKVLHGNFVVDARTGEYRDAATGEVVARASTIAPRPTCTP